MPAASFGDLAQEPSTSLLIGTTTRFGDSVRIKRPRGTIPYPDPDRVHLLCIALDAASQLTVRHMFKKIVASDTVAAVEAALLDDARTHIAQPNPAPATLKGKDFETIKFTAPSYFTLVADETNWEFYFPASASEDQPLADETHDPLIFIDKKTVITASSPDGTSLTTKTQSYKKNTAFYRAQHTTVRGMNAVRLINFFTDENGALLGAETRPYGFEIYVRVPFVAGGPEHRITFIIDPDGQNQGPPAP